MVVGVGQDSAYPKKIKNYGVAQVAARKSHKLKAIGSSPISVTNI